MGVPLVVGLSVLLLAAGVAYLLRVREHQALHASTEVALERVEARIRVRIDEQVKALERLAARWEFHGGLDSREWTAETRRLIEDYQEIQAIEWVDSNHVVRRVTPLEGNESTLGLSLGFEIRRRLVLEAAREQHRAVATKPLELVQGGMGILIYVPMFRSGEFDGFALGAYRLSSLLGEGLSDVAPGYRVRIRYEDDELYTESSRRWSGAAPALVASGPLRILNLSWDVQVATTPEVEAVYLTSIPERVAAIGGAVQGLLLALAVHLARTGRWRTARLLAESARAREEMDRRTQAESAEREARDELRAVVASFPDHVWSAHVSPDGEFHARYYSPVVEEMSGYPPDRYKADPELWIRIVLPEDREAVNEGYRAVVRGHRNSVSLEYRIRHANGEVRAVRDRLRGSDMPYGRRVDGVATDVTDLRRAEDERRSLEARFQQAQRLESLGVLAGGIAHDFNNLLVSMLGHADLALAHLAANDPARKDIGSIEKAARRAAELCRQMLAYAGKGSPKTEPLDLRETVEEMGELLAASTTSQVKTRYEFAEGLPPVEADASQIRQLVMNLITNASEALSGPGGGIDVRAREVFVSAAELASFTFSEGAQAGHFVELCVADDGCGMDAATLGRIFEPFYTRKFAGRGLGLAAALGIVRRHRGAIRIESEPGHGTRATLLLPALEHAVTSKAPALASAEPRRGSGTVLLVDDQADAREVGTIMLERAGFQVVTASGGEEALQLFRAHRSTVVCILLDLTMPGMGGREVHAALRRLSEDVPIVLCSGFPEDAAQELFERDDLSGFLEKPFTTESLLQIIRQALESSHEGA